MQQFFDRSLKLAINQRRTSNSHDVIRKAVDVSTFHYFCDDRSLCESLTHMQHPNMHAPHKLDQCCSCLRAVKFGFLKVGGSYRQPSTFRIVFPIENAAMSTYFLPMASGPIAFLHVKTPDCANLSQFLQSYLKAITLTKISSSIRKPSEAFLKATKILNVPNLVLQVCPHFLHS